MQTILTAIIPLFILIGIGALLQLSLGRPTKVSLLLTRIGFSRGLDWSRVLNSFALYLALPALIFSSLSQASGIYLVPLPVLLYSVFGLLLYLAVLYLVFFNSNLPRDIANTYIFAGFFGNVAYIGFPFLVELLPGTDGALSIVIAIHIAIAFSFGVWILKKSEASKQSILPRLVKNPLLIATVLGFLVLLTPVTLPTVLANAVAMLGQSASPVVLVALGMFIVSNWKIDNTIIHAVGITTIKLVLMPVLFILGSLLLAPSAVLSASVIETAMPVALTTFAMAERYKINKTVAANAIILSTLASLITLTLFSSIVL